LEDALDFALTKRRHDADVRAPRTLVASSRLPVARKIERATVERAEQETNERSEQDSGDLVNAKAAAAREDQIEDEPNDQPDDRSKDRSDDAAAHGIRHRLPRNRVRLVVTERSTDAFRTLLRVCRTHYFAALVVRDRFFHAHDEQPDDEGGDAIDQR